MYYRIPELIPIQLQTVGEFAAPDPWNGGLPAQWLLSVYRMTADNNRALYATYSAEKQREWADGQNLDRDDVLGIRSSVDGLYHILPVALVRLWQRGEVSNVQLPDLIAAVDQRLKRTDFFDPVSGQPWRRYFGYGIAAIGVFFAGVGVWSVIDDLRRNYPVAASLEVWFTMAAFFWLVAGLLLWRLSRSRRRVVVQEAEFAALLQGGAGVFPGRPA